MNNLKEMANILQEQYESVCSTPRQDSQVMDPIQLSAAATNTDQQLTETQLCEQDIDESIKEIMPAAAPALTTSPNTFFF